jgi:hypothetical protein
MKKLLLVVSSAALALTVRGNAIVFDTLGPGGNYNSNSAYGLYANPVSGTTVSEAVRFTAGTSGMLATVDLGLTIWAPNPPGPMNVWLLGDASGSPDNANQTFLGLAGTPTDSFNHTFFSSNSLVSFTVAGNVPVTMGSNYWLALIPATANESIFWQIPSPETLGLVAVSFTHEFFGATTNSLPAFRITAVPDSGRTVFLLLGSVVALFLAQRVLRHDTSNS